MRTAFGVADPGRFRPESLLGARTRRGRFEIRRRARMPLRPPADRPKAIYPAASLLHSGSIEIAHAGGRPHRDRSSISFRPTLSASERRSTDEGSVFWLPDRPNLHAFPASSRSPRRTRRTKRRSDGPVAGTRVPVQFVPGYSDGLAPDSHRLPVSRTRSYPPPGSRHLDVFPRDTPYRRWVFSSPCRKGPQSRRMQRRRGSAANLSVGFGPCILVRKQGHVAPWRPGPRARRPDW